jgi:hypothetical protein
MKTVGSPSRERTQSATTQGRAFKYNKLCQLADWQDPKLRTLIHAMLPDQFVKDPSFPTGREHRKHWEFAQILRGLVELDALPSNGMVLSFGAGHEELVYEMTNRVRWVFATDSPTHRGIAPRRFHLGRH